jgi:ABC-type branched-subunit amino acid transport system permease subunit
MKFNTPPVERYMLYLQNISKLPIILLCFLLAAPFLFSSFRIGLFTQALLFGLFAISVNIALGYTGLLTLSPAVFFGIGAYSVAKTVVAFGGNYFIGVSAGVALAVLIALPVGYIPIRNRIGSVYFALFTLAFGVVAYDFTFTATWLTGGSNGLGYVTLPAIAGISFADTTTYYYFVLSVTTLIILGLNVLLRSDYGNILQGIRQNERRMQYLGYNTIRERITAWGLSCGLSAFAGGLYVGTVGIAAPSMMSFPLTGNVIVWLVVGGIGTLLGPFIAAFVLTIVESLLGGIAPELYLMALGIIFILFVYLLPSGLMGLYAQLYDRLTE